MRYAWAMLAASAAFAPAIAQARESEFAVSTPGGNLADALDTLAAQTGISFTYAGQLPGTTVRPVRGRMSARAALERVLKDTPMSARQIGHHTFRLVRRSAAVPNDEAANDRIGDDIVVTARKLPELLSDAAAPIAIGRPNADPAVRRAPGAGDVARGVEGLTLTGLGPGRDRLFIRGLADSPFNGFSQSPVSVQIDEGRVTYDAAEPGLRLVDVDRVEVLKGPQGPLYGTGALGGVYRIVTNRPVIGSTSGSADIEFQSVANGGLGASVDAVINLPLVPDVAAIRVVGYSGIDPGWIDDLPGPRNANQIFTRGGRMALRVLPAPGWLVDVSAAGQWIDARDSQYVYRDGEDLTRDATLLEPRSGSFRYTQGAVSGPIGTLQLIAATSYGWQDQADIYDATGGAAGLGIADAVAYLDRRSYRLFDQEVRLQSAPGSSIAWTAGASYLSATTQATGDVRIASGTSQPYFTLHRLVTEAAIYAEASMLITERLRGSIGARAFRTTTDDERLEDSGGTFRARASTGVTPSASLSLDMGRGRSVYLRFGTAFRPGGIDPGNTVTGRYDSDEVRSFDLGTRLRLANGRMSLNLALFSSDWRHVQSDYLEPNGLVATRNAGDASILGGEAAIDWQPWAGWTMRGGATVQRARLVHASDGSELPAALRLPLIPDIAFRMEIERRLSLGAVVVTPFVRINGQGPTRLSFDEGLDRHMRSYAVAGAGAGMAFARLDLRLAVDNVFDTRADSFAFGNPFSVRQRPQFTPLQPRTMRFSVSRHF